jgi:sugar/nucleoside kinase (ribokinase family)
MMSGDWFEDYIREELEAMGVDTETYLSLLLQNEINKEIIANIRKSLRGNPE